MVVSRRRDPGGGGLRLCVRVARFERKDPVRAAADSPVRACFRSNQSCRHLRELRHSPQPQGRHAGGRFRTSAGRADSVDAVPPKGDGGASLRGVFGDRVWAEVLLFERAAVVVDCELVEAFERAHDAVAFVWGAVG
jgi:hypothetical protein